MTDYIELALGDEEEDEERGDPVLPPRLRREWARAGANAAAPARTAEQHLRQAETGRDGGEQADRTRRTPPMTGRMDGSDGGGTRKMGERTPLRPPARTEPWRGEDPPAEAGGQESLYAALQLGLRRAERVKRRQGTQTVILPESEAAQGPAGDPETLDRLFQRDARRYDGGFLRY